MLENLFTLHSVNLADQALEMDLDVVSLSGQTHLSFLLSVQ